MNKSIKIILFNSKNIKDLAYFLGKIIFLEKKIFPKEWLYPDAKKYYKEILKNYSTNINLLIEYNKKIVGYLLVVPIESSFDELRKKDKKIIFNKNSFYVETVQILPEYRDKGLYKVVLKKLINILKRRKIKKLGIHARINNGTVDKTVGILSLLGVKISERRKIKKWYYGGNEPYEYICFKL
jgi:hypothetical protein